MTGTSQSSEAAGELSPTDFRPGSGFLSSGEFYSSFLFISYMQTGLFTKCCELVVSSVQQISAQVAVSFLPENSILVFFL
jgi:hypothetical protein